MKRLILILLLILVQPVKAELIRETYEGVRPTGMGNAYLALADDADVIWYNPAALTKVKGYHFDLFNFTGGADSLSTLNTFTNAIFNGNYSGLVNPASTTAVRFDYNPSFITKYFGFSVYSHTTGYWNIQNLQLPSQLPSVDIAAYSDLGAILAMGLPVGDYLSLGLSVRGFVRTGVDAYLTASQLLSNLGNITQQQFLNAAYNELKKMNTEGYGIGLDLGSLVTIPTGGRNAPVVQLGATVEDVGNTSFYSVGSNAAPPAIPMSVNVGSALLYTLNRNSNLNLTADVRHLTEGYAFVKMSHVGLEYKYRFLSLRTGFSEGYVSYGFSLEPLPHTHIHFSSYGEEVGTSYQSQQLRVYLCQLQIGFNPF